MKFAIPVILLAIISLFYFSKGPKSLSGEILQQVVNLPSSGLERHLPCRDKEKCLIVYITPWCSACKTFEKYILPSLPESLDLYSKNAGMSIIIGKDNPGKINFMGSRIQLPFISDADGKFYRALGTSAVPSFFVVNSSGKIIKQRTGFSAKGSTPEEMAKNFALNFVGK
ncbi:MAG: redoxin family protein [Halobacteriovoraceae bacterium]|jgi:hypothetical protein|nr:redoxin family protein [Halobacteriovoraceae bacterium]MBT5093420.1 redoxin family protein [Halobacteriovoraceae bacterium]